MKEGQAKTTIARAPQGAGARMRDAQVLRVIEQLDGLQGYYSEMLLRDPGSRPQIGAAKHIHKTLPVLAKM